MIELFYLGAACVGCLWMARRAAPRACRVSVTRSRYDGERAAIANGLDLYGDR